MLDAEREIRISFNTVLPACNETKQAGCERERMSTGSERGPLVARKPGMSYTRSSSSHLAPAKDQHCLTKLDFIAILERIGLVFIDWLAIDLCAIRAPFISERVVPISLTDD